MDRTTPRIIFEMGTIVTAKGHADGITRAVQNFQRYAADHRPDVVFAVYDVAEGHFLAMNPLRLDAVMAGARVDMSHIADPFALKPRLRERFPKPLRHAVHAIQRPRRRAFLLTERIRLSLKTRSPLLERFQEWLLNEKYRAELSDGLGGRRTLFPFDMAFGRPIRTGRDDIALFVGADFPSMQRCALRRDDPDSPRMVAMCQDIIPLMFPQYFKPQQVERFRACFHAVFPHADLTIFSTARIESDVRDYCSRNGHTLRRSAVVPLGADTAAPRQAPTGALPQHLDPGHYALFVSTIEPRKNHRLLFEVWKRLLADNVPQRHGFKLVFVGRPGWLTDDLMADMKAHPSYQGSLLVLSDVNDDALRRLYADSAFCLYPSLYEGFGLPIIEAFRYGKAVIASTGGALPEVVQHFSPTLDPNDIEAWTDLFKRWIEKPAARDPYERLIRQDFRARDWDSAAEHLYRTIDRELGSGADADERHSGAG